MRRLPLLCAVSLALLATPAHAAPSWTAVTSNTTDNIQAIEYQGDSRAWFATAAGKIFTRSGGTWTERYSQAGVSFYDIRFQRNGQRGIAVGENASGGVVVYSGDGGATWAAATIPSSNDSTCSSALPLGPVRKVAFAADDTAFLWASTNQVMRSAGPNVGASWTNHNPNGSGACRVNYRNPVTGAFLLATNPAQGWAMTQDFGDVFGSTNDFQSAFERSNRGPNGFTTAHKLVGDPANPNRQWAVAVKEGGNPSYFVRTEDAWSNQLYMEGGNPSRRDRASAEDIAFNGGTVLIAGAGGQILNSIDGRKFFFVDDPANASANWLAVGMASAKSALVGGEGGRLIQTANADSLPDVTPPTGTITGPDRVAVRTPTQFTGQLADEAGGSGINPASLMWSVAGLPSQSGNPVSFSFPNVGSFTIRLSFSDNAGNRTEISKTVEVVAPFGVLPAKTPATARRRGSRIQIKVKGKLGIPAGLKASSACKGAVAIAVRAGGKVVGTGTAKLSRSCRFKRTLRVLRKRVGTTKTLAVTVRFLGNAVMSTSEQTYSVKIR